MNMPPTTERALTRLARLLFWTPVVLAVPVFYFVGHAVPDLNHGSIGDGFRRLNVFVSAVFPVGAVCWLSAMAIVVYVGLSKSTNSLSMACLGLLIVMAVLVVALL